MATSVLAALERRDRSAVLVGERRRTADRLGLDLLRRRACGDALHDFDLGRGAARGSGRAIVSLRCWTPPTATPAAAAAPRRRRTRRARPTSLRS
jgi:hypothetical protein